MIKTLHILLGAAALFAFWGANAGNMYPWRNHAAPYPRRPGRPLSAYCCHSLVGLWNPGQ